MKEKALYTFNWIGGGFNQVWATTKAEAVKEIARQFPGTSGGWNGKPDLKSFKRLTSRKAQNAYWDSIPLMD